MNPPRWRRQRRRGGARLGGGEGVADQRHVVHRGERREDAHAAHVDDVQRRGQELRTAGSES